VYRQGKGEELAKAIPDPGGRRYGYAGYEVGLWRKQKPGVFNYVMHLRVD
jgi:hypothetical protein